DFAPMRRDRRARLEALRTGDGRELPPHLKAQIGRELDRIELLLGQIKTVEAAQDALLAAARKPASEDAAPDPVTMLLALKAVGANFAAVPWSEAFYRQFANRRQVAAYAGLAATPWQSGGVRHEQGVSKAGNPRLRTTMIQFAWLWIRHRPQARDRGAGAQASRGIVGVCHPGRRHRGGRDEARRLIRNQAQQQAPPPSRNQTSITHLPGPDQPRKIRVDEPMDCMASNAATKNGLVLSSLPAASGILVRSPCATTECEFDLARNPDRRTGSNPGSQLRGSLMP